MRLPEDGCSVCKSCTEWFPVYFAACRFCDGPLWDVEYVPPPRPGELGAWKWHRPGELSPAARFALYSHHRLAHPKTRGSLATGETRIVEAKKKT